MVPEGACTGPNHRNRPTGRPPLVRDFVRIRERLVELAGVPPPQCLRNQDLRGHPTTNPANRTFYTS